MTTRNLYVRAPMFDPGGGKEGDRVWALYLWRDKNLTRILDKFHITYDNIEAITTRRTLVLQQKDIKNSITVLYPKKERAAAAKGLTIRLELMAILDAIIPADLKHSYFVQIDGSGAINYSGIELVLTKLINDPNCPEVVLGRRPQKSKDWFMGHPERKAIELFEKFLIEERFRKIVDEEFGGELPDAQAGCWGLRLDTLRKLSLTAGGYELELDVITSALELLEHGLLEKKKVAFTTDLSRGPRIGGGGRGGSDTFEFKRGNTIDKYPLLLHKLGYDKGKLGRVLEKFDKSTLPQEYVAAVHEWITN